MQENSKKDSTSFRRKKTGFSKVSHKKIQKSNKITQVSNMLRCTPIPSQLLHRRRPVGSRKSTPLFPAASCGSSCHASSASGDEPHHRLSVKQCFLLLRPRATAAPLASSPLTPATNRPVTSLRSFASSGCEPSAASIGLHDFSIPPPTALDMSEREGGIR